MEAAEGAIKVAASKLYPEIATRGALTEQSRGRLFEGIATGAAAGVLWELDLWGRVRAGKAAASENIPEHKQRITSSQDSLWRRRLPEVGSWRARHMNSANSPGRGAANFEQLLGLTKVREGSKDLPRMRM